MAQHYTKKFADFQLRRIMYVPLLFSQNISRGTNVLGTKWQSVTGRLRQVVFAPNYVTQTLLELCYVRSLWARQACGACPLEMRSLLRELMDCLLRK